MDFRDREVDFQGADRRYEELTRQRDAGIINDQEFDAQRQRLMVRDDQGRWWAKLGESGEWHYRDDKTWIRGTPPGYREQVVPEPTNYFEEVDRRYAQVKRLHQAGEITQEEFDEQLKRLMVQDERGRWWSKSRKNGEWHYNDGSSWIVGTPLGYSPPSGSDQFEGKRNLTVDGVALSRAEIPWGRILLIAGLVLMVLIVVVLLVVGVGTYLSTSPRLGSGFLKGKTLSEAAQTVGTDYELEVRGVTPYTSQPKGTIAETPQPYQDEPIPRGSVIPLWLSSGKEDVTVPDVTDMSVLQASKTLLDAGLDAHASGDEDGWIRMRLDQNGQPMAAILHADLDDKPGAVGEDVSQRTVTKAELSGSSEPAAGSKTEAGTLIFLEYS